MLRELYQTGTVLNPDYISSIEEYRRIKTCSDLLVRHFREHRPLVLDADGVVVEQDGLTAPRFTSPSIVHALTVLERLDVPIGVATARSRHYVDFLRSQGLRLEGPLILEEGQIIETEGRIKTFAHENHSDFIIALKHIFTNHPNWAKSWEAILYSQRDTKDFLFCNGNPQWQGVNRISYWFLSDGIDERDADIKLTIFDQLIDQVGSAFNLERDIDYVTNFSKLSLARLGIDGYLGMLSIKGVKDGRPIDKSIAAHYYGNPFAYVADGFGDLEIGRWNRSMGGLNVGIKGNLDLSSDPLEYFTQCEHILENPRKLVWTLFSSAQILAAYR